MPLVPGQFHTIFFCEITAVYPVMLVFVGLQFYTDVSQQRMHKQQPNMSI